MFKIGVFNSLLEERIEKYALGHAKKTLTSLIRTFLLLCKMYTTRFDMVKLSLNESARYEVSRCFSLFKVLQARVNSITCGALFISADTNGSIIHFSAA